MLGPQIDPVGVELFSYAKVLFFYDKFAYMLATWVKTFYKGAYTWLNSWSQ